MNMNDIRSRVAQHALQYGDRTASNKYAPKLSEQERRECLAFHLLRGYPDWAIIKAYGINRSTFRHMVRTNSGHYRKYREEAATEGFEQFIQRVLTPQAFDRIEAAMKTGRPTPDHLKPALQRGGDPDPRANKYEGEHQFYDGVEEAYYTIEIKYCTDLPPKYEGAEPLPDGWYYRIVADPYGSPPATTFGGAPDHRYTSATCYEAAKHKYSVKPY